MPIERVGQRDLILHTKSNQMQRISELPRAYDTLQYPLLIPHSTDVWSLEHKIDKYCRYKITQLQYYCFNFHLYALGISFCKQFIVEDYAKIEPERLQYLRREQGGLRADSYRDLQKTIVNQDEL